MKKCTKCLQEKEFSEFNKKAGKPDGLQPYCRDCAKEHAKLYYDQHKEKLRKQINESRRVRMNENKGKMYKILESAECLDCKVSYHPFAMQFDHRDPKTKIDSISEMLAAGQAWSRIEEEMKKCDILCANCHYIRTGKAHGWYSNATMAA